MARFIALLIARVTASLSMLAYQRENIVFLSIIQLPTWAVCQFVAS